MPVKKQEKKEKIVPKQEEEEEEEDEEEEDGVEVRCCVISQRGTRGLIQRGRF